MSETGLFGIFGPTGSGKSTVLDAITLALYGKVHRATNGTQGIINSGLNNVKTSFTFDILKDGSRKTYRVERVYTRKKGSDNSCEAKLARLIEISSDIELPIADKNSEVSDRIEALLGLKHEDFTRAVVLPQNKFQEFLQLKNADKSKMLERIFYLEDYGKRLNEKVSLRSYAVKDKLSRTESALSVLGDASDEKMEEAVYNFKASKDFKEKSEKEFKQEETFYNESKEVWELICELSMNREKISEHHKDKEVVENNRLMLENSIKADSLKELLERYNNTSEKLTATETRLKTVNGELPELLTQLENERCEHEKVVLKKENEAPRLIDKKNKLLAAVELSGEIKELDSKILNMRSDYKNMKDRTIELITEIDKQTGGCKLLEKDLEELKLRAEGMKITAQHRNQILYGIKLEDELEKAKTDLMKIIAEHSETSETVSALIIRQKNCSGSVEKKKAEIENLLQLEKLHLNEKPLSREELLNDLHSFHYLKANLSNLKISFNNVVLLREKIESIITLIEKQRVGLELIDSNFMKYGNDKETLGCKINECKSIIEKNTVYILAKKLLPGCQCPVCGSIDHPVPANYESSPDNMGNIEKELEEYKGKLIEVEVLFKQENDKLIEKKAQLQMYEAQLLQTKSELSYAEKVYDTLTAGLPANLRQLEISRLEQEMDKTIRESDERQIKLNDWEKKLEEIKSNLKVLNEELALELMKENGINSELQVYNESLDKISRAMDKGIADCENKKTSFEDFLIKNEIKNLQYELSKINENDKILEKLQITEKSNSDKILVVRRKLEELEAKRLDFNNSMIGLETDGKHFKSQKEEKETKLREIFNSSSDLSESEPKTAELDIDTELKKIDEKISEISLYEKQLKLSIKVLEEKYNIMLFEKERLDCEKAIFNKTLEAEKLIINKAFSEKGFLSIDQIQEALLSKEKQRELSEIIESYDKIERNLLAQKSMIETKLKGRSISETEWKKALEAFLEKKTSREEALSNYEVSKNIYETIKLRHDRWVALNSEYAEYSRKAELVDQIRNLLKGNGFIEYIAEERLKYIAQEASEILGIMTKFRFALELDSDCGFIIRDNSNGGAHRMITSLSGGETFLTSLSLALALSKQIQLKGQSPLEFFFLDEGFGTLDNNLVDTVIDALEKLSSSDRVIGLISHVPELRNRIARRLIIEPPDNNGAGSRIKIEKA